MSRPSATWLTRGAMAATSILVTLIAIPRLGIGRGGDLLVTIAGAQLGGVVASSVSGTHAFRLGVTGTPLRSRAGARLFGRSLALFLTTIITAVAVTRTANVGVAASDLSVNIALGSLGLLFSRIVAEHRKGSGNPASSTLLETAPAIVASLAVLAIGPGALAYLGWLILLAAASLIALARRPGDPALEPPGTHGLRRRPGSLGDGLLLAIVPLVILFTTYGPLLWLKGTGASEDVVATYAILQRSFAPVTIGLGIVNVLHLRGIVSPYFVGDTDSFARAARKSTRSARLVSLPLLVASFGLATIALRLAGIFSARTMLAAAVLTLAQSSNASVGIPTEINLAIGRKRAEILGSVGAIGAMLVVLVSFGQSSPTTALFAAVGSTLAAQLIRNAVSFLNLRSAVIDLRSNVLNPTQRAIVDLVLKLAPQGGLIASSCPDSDDLVRVAAEARPDLRPTTSDADSIDLVIATSALENLAEVGLRLRDDGLVVVALAPGSELLGWHPVLAGGDALAIRRSNSGSASAKPNDNSRVINVT